jgi:hypothetical protein
LTKAVPAPTNKTNNNKHPFNPKNQMINKTKLLFNKTKSALTKIHFMLDKLKATTTKTEPAPNTKNRNLMKAELML